MRKSHFVAAALVAGVLVVLAPPAQAAVPTTCLGHPVTIMGSDGDDDIVGTGDNDVIATGNGRDAIDAQGGNDIVCAGPGNDIVNGGSGDDIMVAEAVPDGQDIFVGGGGILDSDTVTYNARTTAVEVSLDNLANDGAAGERDLNSPDVSNIIGGRGDDRLSGSAERSGGELLGGPGNDELFALGADTRLSGGPGDDGLVAPQNRLGFNEPELFGGAGDDTLIGGPDNDLLQGGPGNDTLGGQDGDDIARADAGVDGADTFVGGPGTDTADYAARDNRSRATVLNVTISGNNANDGEPGEGDDIRDDVENVNGGTGVNTIVGNGLANELNGGDSNDVISAVDQVSGNDSVSGRGGADTCRADPGDFVLCEQ